MGTNELQQSLLSAVDLLSQKAANSTNAAITIKGEIIEEIDSGRHIYSVSYGGAIYRDAYAAGGVVYPVSSVVYLLVPDGNFDNPKIILGSVTPVANNFVTEQETDIYVPVSDNLFDTINNNEEINLKSWATRPEDKQKNIINNDNIAKFSMVFPNYLNKFRNFMITAEIKTNILKDYQSKGNYGLALTLFFKQPGEVQNRGQQDETSTFETFRTYTIDTHNIQGNPYALNEYQKVIFYGSVDDSLTYDTSKSPQFYAFVNGFEYGEYNPDEDPDVKFDSDIHIKNVSVRMVDVLTEEEVNGYYLTVVGSKGSYFLEEDPEDTVKTLTPIFKAKGKTVKSLTDWDCYWYEEDSSVNTASEYYNTIGALGWKCLNEKTNGVYVTNSYTLNIKKSDVTHTLRYKCVLVKRDEDLIVPGTIEIKSLGSEVKNISLISGTGFNVFPENIGEVRLIARLYAEKTFIYYDSDTKKGRNLFVEWQRFDKNNNFIDDEAHNSQNTDNTNIFYTLIRDNEYNRDEKCYETEISYPCNLLDKMNTIKCSFYQTSGGVQKNLGTASITVTTTKELTYRVVIDNGDVLYKYDVDGDSPRVADYDGPISSQIKTIQPLSFRIFKPDGTELNETEYKYAKYKWSFPKNSMMILEGFDKKELEQDDNYYYIKNANMINYTIEDVYNKKKNDNTVLITVEIDDCKISDSASPKFLKDGEGGTNGSKYAAIIRYNDDPDDDDNYAYNEKDGEGRYRKFHGVYVVDEGKWYLYGYNSVTKKIELYEFDESKFIVDVYKDGVKYSTNYTISWDIYDDFDGEKAATACFSIDNTGKLTKKYLKNEQGEVTSNFVKWNDKDTIYCSSIRCEVTIPDDSATNNSEIVRAYYPLEITRLKSRYITYDYIDSKGAHIFGQKINSDFPSLIGGFEEVLYASDGTNPQYDSSAPFKCIDGIYDEDIDKKEDLLDYNWDTSKHLKISGDRTKSSVNIKPTTRFDNGNTQNYVKVSLQASASKRDKVKEKLDKIGEDINNKEKEYKFYHGRDDYEGQINLVHNFQNKYNYTTYKRRLDQAKEVLDFRYNLLNYMCQFNDLLEQINTYCIEHNVNRRIQTDEGYIIDFDYHYDTYPNKIANFYKQIFQLGSLTSLNSLTSDIYESLKLTVNVDDLSKAYKGIVGQQLEIFISEWNIIIANYNDTFKENWQQYYAFSYTALVYFINLIKNLQDVSEATGRNNPLYKLIHSNSDGLGPEMRYQLLHDDLEKIYQQLLDFNIPKNDEEKKNKLLTNYDSFLNDMLNKIHKVMRPYIIVGYQERQYSEIIDKINLELEQLHMEYNEYNNLDLKDEEYLIIHIKPIIMLYNTYEFGNINAWDGTKLYIDEKNNEYLLAPQIGAGTKKDGKFSGMLMGIKQFNKQSNNQLIGLFGYGDGVQSMFLNAKDGSAIFGKVITPREAGEDNEHYDKRKKASGGQIILDPVYGGAIYSGNYWKEYGSDGKPTSYARGTGGNENHQGMIIDLVTPEIAYGNGNFRVDEEGKIKSIAGSIGGWELDSYRIYSNKDTNKRRITLEVPHDLVYDGYEWNGYVIFCITADVKDKENPDNTIYYIGNPIKDAQGKVINIVNMHKVLKWGMAIEHGYEGFYIYYEQPYEPQEFYPDGQYHYIVTTDPAEIFTTVAEYIQGKQIVYEYKIPQYGKIFSEKHYTLDSTNEGFYLSNDGLSIYDTIKITSENGGKIYVGKVNSTNNYYWTICGEAVSNSGIDSKIIKRSYISYNTDNREYEVSDNESGGGKYIDTKKTHPKSDQVYIGTDGFRLGSTFFVDIENDIGLFKGKMEAIEGDIAGWGITKNGLRYIDEKTEYSINNKKYYKSFIIQPDGYIGTCLINKNNYSDMIKDYDVIKQAIGSSFWMLKSNGSIYCETPGSRLGGIFVESGNPGGSVFVTNHDTNTYFDDGIFQHHAQREIEEIVQDCIKIVDADGTESTLKLKRKSNDLYD